LKNEIANKDEDYEKVCSDMKRSLYRSENNVQQLQYKLSKKDEDVSNLSKKNTEMCQLNGKLQDQLVSFKKRLDGLEKESKTITDENTKMKRNYERIINDVRYIVIISSKSS
jgi:chromosome segregation ATPase